MADSSPPDDGIDPPAHCADLRSWHLYVAEQQSTQMRHSPHLVIFWKALLTSYKRSTVPTDSLSAPSLRE